MKSFEAKIAALDAKIDAIRAKRLRLQKKMEEHRARHQSTADLEVRLRGATLQQLRAELTVERRRFKRYGKRERVGSAAVKSRQRAQVIAKKIEERQTNEHAVS